MHLTSPDQIVNAKPFSFTWWRYSDYLACQRYSRLYEIVKRYFPYVQASDYGMDYHQPAQLMAWGQAGDPGHIPGRTGCHVGTHQAPSLYGVITYLGSVVVDGRPSASVPSGRRCTPPTSCARRCWRTRGCR